MELLMARATVTEVDKRLSSHEAACEQRWKENYRRLDAIENAITSVNKTIRNTLIFVLTIFLGVTGFLLQEVIYQAIA
tara:strand:- start:1990 stop:2223 length:234 start_codon:yes stop_codon:yes gene_type:complete